MIYETNVLSNKWLSLYIMISVFWKYLKPLCKQMINLKENYPFLIEILESF